MNCDVRVAVHVVEILNSLIVRHIFSIREDVQYSRRTFSVFWLSSRNFFKGGNLLLCKFLLLC